MWVIGGVTLMESKEAMDEDTKRACDEGSDPKNSRFARAQPFSKELDDFAPFPYEELEHGVHVPRQNYGAAIHALHVERLSSDNGQEPKGVLSRKIRVKKPGLGREMHRCERENGVRMWTVLAIR